MSLEAEFANLTAGIHRLATAFEGMLALAPAAPQMTRVAPAATVAAPVAETAAATIDQRPKAPVAGAPAPTAAAPTLDDVKKAFRAMAAGFTGDDAAKRAAQATADILGRAGAAKLGEVKPEAYPQLLVDIAAVLAGGAV